MAGASKSSSKGPLPGSYMEFEFPIKEDVKDADKSTQETVYCKEPVALFLGLTPAKARVGTFTKGKNNGKKFALRGSKGQKPFKIILKNGTKIDVVPPGATSKTSRPVKSITISVPNTVSVAELREFLMTKTKAKDNILGMVSPDGRVYTWSGELGTKPPGVEETTTN